VSNPVRTMIYTTLFIIGLLGLVVLALLGAGHGGHAHGGAGGHGHGGHALGHGHSNVAGHGSGHNHTGHNHSSGQNHQRDEFSARAWGLFSSLLSPLTLFTLCLGAGATGILLRPMHWPSFLVGLAASVGAIVLNAAVVRPLWAFIFKFASTPSGALDATVAQTAEAMTPFDAAGRGIVCVNVDGQLVRILATLEADEKAAAQIVKPGDHLTITSIDGSSNQCRVARI